MTAKSPGVATIAATTVDGGYTAFCEVTAAVRATGVSLSMTSLQLKVDQSHSLYARVEPATATNKTVNWTSSRTDVAVVDAEGVVTAKGVGVATIVATTVDGGHTALCEVTVVGEGEEDTSVDAAAHLLTLFPNPAQSQIAVGGLESAASVVILNSQGSVVHSAVVQVGEWIDISSLPAGVYILRVEGVSLRFVKE